MSGDTKVLSRRQRERLRHKQEILNAALRLFSTKGFHNVSMQEIASGAEFAIGTLYKFFPSKEALFDELVKASGQRIAVDMTAVLDQPGTEAGRLRNYFRSLAGQLEQHSPFIRLYISEMGMRGGKLAKEHDQPKVKALLSSKIRSLLEAGIRKGLFRAVDVDVAVVAITSTVEALAFEMAGDFDRGKAASVFESVEHFFLDGLLRLEAPPQ
ncbi:MAG TPA: TetR/AcrR family transcriptional regulator [Phycisphaerales bacterium]|nr:TetR/AcrR family transcriptional regulator [Phycisphaerales bacterium]